MRLLHLHITLAILLLFVKISVAGEGENQVMAAMLYNFAKFVEWPADSFSSDSGITFCIAGKSPLNNPLQQMQGKPVKGRTVSVRQIARPDDVAGCQILFISLSEHGRLPVYLRQTNHRSILTVSDLERFTAYGGMIGFYEEDNRIRFEINPEAVQKSRLQISSHLLNLARRSRQ